MIKVSRMRMHASTYVCTTRSQSRIDLYTMNALSNTSWYVYARAAPVKIYVRRTQAHIKDTFRGVNAVLAHVEATQAAWSIPDALLRGNLREAICEDVLPPYEVLILSSAFTMSL